MVVRIAIKGEKGGYAEVILDVCCPCHVSLSVSSVFLFHILGTLVVMLGPTEQPRAIFPSQGPLITSAKSDK